MKDHEDINLTDLTAYQLRFIDEYMKCGNKRQAMLNAGYKGKGKRSTVTSSAAKLYNVPKVKAEIERRRRALAEENMIDSKAIVNRLSKMFNGELSSQFVTTLTESMILLVMSPFRIPLSICPITLCKYPSLPPIFSSLSFITTRSGPSPTPSHPCFFQ